MEHAQRVEQFEGRILEPSCLNPYFNGTCSKSTASMDEFNKLVEDGLNPYFNGTCSKRTQQQQQPNKQLLS